MQARALMSKIMRWLWVAVLVFVIISSVLYLAESIKHP